MESIHTLKKCFDFVAGLSRKLLGTSTSLTAGTNVEKAPQQSHANVQKLDQITANANSIGKKTFQRPQTYKHQTPKIICFESYMRSKTDPLKTKTLKPLTTHDKIDKRPINQVNENLNSHQTLRANDYYGKTHQNQNIENYYENKLEIKLHKNTQTKLNKIENSQIKFFQSKVSEKFNPLNINRKQTLKFAQDDEEGEGLVVELGKKDMKNLKKNCKNPQVAESVAINSDSVPFTYEDGDDISSIAQKSETTDQIQPELLFFIDKRTMMAYSKLQQPKSNLVIMLNMKKKANHQQGQITAKNSPIKQPQQQQEPRPKKRTFQLYPGETIQQFKKRVLVRYPASGDSESDDSSLVKPIKREDYNKILNQLNDSRSQMEQQKQKSFSQNKAQKMVDESENQQSQGQQEQVQDGYLQQQENYSSWNNNLQIKNKFHFYET